MEGAGPVPYTFVEGRVVMPTALFPAAPKAAQTGKTALAPILAEEEGWAKKANQERLQARGIGGRSSDNWGHPDRTAGLVASLRAPAPNHFRWRLLSGSARFLQPGGIECTVELQEDAGPGPDCHHTGPGPAPFHTPGSGERGGAPAAGIKRGNHLPDHLLPPPDPAAARRSQDAVLQPHERQLLDFLCDEVGEGRESLYLTDIERFSKQKATQFYGFWKEWTSGLITRGEGSGFLTPAAI